MSAGRQKIPLKEWNGFKSLEPYGQEFNKSLKLKIRERDSYTCQECDLSEMKFNKNLCIHHIDYDKKNNSQLNLISLCNRCHLKTNSNRNHWSKYFQMKMFLKEFFNPNNILAFDENKKLVGMQRC